MKKIAEFYTIEVYAIDKSDTIILYYHGGDVSYPPITLHMNIFTGEVEEDITELYISHTLNAWYSDYKFDLIDMYESEEYRTLPDWG